MAKEVDLYTTQYGHDKEQIYQQIRVATYGQDLGQSSWITLEEAKHFAVWLELSSGSNVLEVACGAGGISCLIHEQFGAKVHGVDISEEAVDVANARCDEQGFGEKVTFSVQDASKPLQFPDRDFDAVFCNDSINHLSDRDQVLADWWRLLAPNGRLLFTDPILVTGIISNEETRIRSSIGFYLFTPNGENERLLEAAGFRVLRVEDVTAHVEETSRRWYDARQERQGQLLLFEEKEQFDGLQNFLSVVHQLAADRRLSRYAYLAEKEG